MIVLFVRVIIILFLNIWKIDNDSRNVEEIGGKWKVKEKKLSFLNKIGMVYFFFVYLNIYLCVYIDIK